MEEKSQRSEGDQNRETAETKTAETSSSHAHESWKLSTRSTFSKNIAVISVVEAIRQIAPRVERHRVRFAANAQDRSFVRFLCDSDLISREARTMGRVHALFDR